jgi:hypothetical protein
MATAFVNKHMTRVLAAGGTVADATWLSTVDAWITSQNLYPYLFDWTNPALGVIKDGSNNISKLLGLGTTWLPRLGDLTPSAPTSTAYAATGIGGLPAWTNTSNTAYSYWGAARSGTVRTQQIRRKHNQGLTLVAVYKKNHAFQSTMFGEGTLSSARIVLQNTAGSPGSCKAYIGAPSFTATHATTLANNAVHIIGATFDGDTLTTFVEGSAGAQATGYIITYTDDNKSQYRPLFGGANLNNQIYYQMLSGSAEGTFTQSSTSTSRTITAGTNEADMTVSDLIMFYTALTPTQMASLNSTLRTRYGP